MARKIPKKILGLPTPVVIVGGVAVVAYFYLRHSAVASGVKAAGTTSGGGMGGRGRQGEPGRRGKPGKPGRTIRQVVLICPPGYHRVKGHGCHRNARKPHHPAHHLLAAQGG